MKTPEQENIEQRARLNLIHDHLHHERFNEAHAVCHCDSVEDLDKPLDGSHVTQSEAAAALERFAHDFNRLAIDAGLMACWVGFVPSATNRDMVSVQLGGNVDAIQQLRHMLGMKKASAVGNHSGKENT